MRSPRILVVDDEPHARTALAALLRGESFDVETAADAFKALGKLDSFAPRIVITDFKMPGMDGIELTRKLLAREDPPAVIVMTAFGAIGTALTAMRAGASDYLLKPLSFDELLISVNRTLEEQSLRREAAQLRVRVKERFAIENMVGTSPAMQSVYDIIRQAAPSRATVLITGESGTGKELVANALHQNSPRAERPFIKVHCAALAESLLESELFGHEKGAFTGASARRDGRFTLADGGTLFLDEIGEISASTQLKLLRVLQEQEFERVGGTETQHVDVRVVAATNRNLVDAVESGRFRKDLYFRLHVVTIEMPPLRKRGGDVLLIARMFLERFARDNNKQIEGFATETATQIARYDWPGNVRELENAIERAVLLSKDALVPLSALPTTVKPARADNDPPAVPGATLAELERYTILETLRMCDGSTTRAAAILGLSLRTVQYRVNQYRDADAAARNGGESVPLSN